MFDAPIPPPVVTPPPTLSPLLLSDRLLTLAQDAWTVGCRRTATQLLDLAHAVLDELTVVA